MDFQNEHSHHTEHQQAAVKFWEEQGGEGCFVLPQIFKKKKLSFSTEEKKAHRNK